MKQFTISNQLTAIGKRIAMVLTMLLIVGIGQAWGAETTTYTFNSKSWGDSSNGWTSGKDGNQFTTNQGVQVTTGVTGANATTKNSFTNISRIAVQYCTNASKGAGSIKIQVGSNTQKSLSVTKPSSNGTTLKTATFTFDPNETGKVKITVDCTANSVYIYSVAITTADAVTCTTPPTVSAGSSSNVAATTATVSCSSGITSLGSAGCSITSYGFVYGTSSNPTISNTKVQVGTIYTTTGTAFSKELTGLTANTTYYVRPYATNGNGTAYGTQTSFKTLELPKYTVTLNAGPGTCAASVTETSAGAGVTLPTPTLDGCDEWSFAGWTTSSVANETSSKPATLLTGIYKPSNNITLYAVYQRTEETEGNGGETEVTNELSFANTNQRTSYSTTEQVWEQNGITLTNDKSSSTSNVGDYSDPARFYKSSKITITAPGNITKIQFKCVSSYVISIDGASTSGTTVTVTLNGTSDTYIVSSLSAQVRLNSISVTYTTSGGSSSTTYYHSTPDCAAGDPCASLQAPNVTATATANSITLSWAAVPGATSYNIYNYTTEEIDETTNLTYTFNGLDPETEYEWGIESAKDECFKETRGTTTTQKACTDAVTISKGTETNGTFTLSTTALQSTCDGSVTVTISNIQPATGYQFSAITQSGVDAAKVTIDNTAKTVTYAQNTSGTSIINVTFTPAVYTINYKDQGGANFSGQHEAGYPQNHTYNTATTLKSASKEHYTFDGWYKESDCSGTKVITLGATDYTNNITLYAKWTANTYTITFNAGTGECVTGSATTTNVGGVTLPIATHTCTDWTFAGWWTEEVSSTNTSPGTLLNAGDTYNPTSDITLYAVYSTQEAGDAFTGYAKVTTAPDDWSGKYLLSTGTYTANGTYDSNGANGHLVRETYTPGNEEKAGWEFTLAKVGNTGYSILFPDGSYYLGYASSTNFARSTTVVQSDNQAYLWSPSTSGITNVSATSRKIADDGTDDFRPYSSPSSGIVYLYKRIGGGTTTIYNSNPTCLVPIWEGATIDKTSFTVNCGGRSPMTGANGAAIISFPTEKIYNFTKDITIEATTGFLVSTSQTEDANYKSLVPLSPLVGTANANTFYDKHVYVRAEAPAMSEEDLSGTITIKNNKGETLQTFSVTADVTCTQYTLTLVDRGVSTLQPETYFAGQTIDEAPADPEGVCTDPIHYVFDGWAEATVAEGSTTYTKVTFPYTVTGNTKFYAVYRYLEGGGNGDYNLVTSALDDWSGDYLIAYSNTIFADGQIGGKDALGAIGAAGINVDLSQYISNNTIPATEGDKYNVTLEAVMGGYVLKTKDGNYNYYTTNESNGISVSTNNTAANYPITVKFVSEEEINLCLGGGAIGSVFRYNAQGFFRFYKNGGQNPVYLYKKADGTTYYTTSPVCGPHLAITEGKDIYVTGGNAGGTRDLVIAQQKVSYKATRLNVGPTSQVPDVKVATNGITVGGVVTSDVKVTIDQTKEQQADGTYTITGTITIQYQPSANNKQEDIQVQLAVDYNTDAKDNFTVHARSLPAEFVIVAKSGDKWYALNGDMANGSSANPANGQVTLDNDANPTKATYAPCNTIYTFDGVPNTGDRTRVRFQGTDGAWLWAASGTNVGIQNKSLKDTPEGDNKAYNWKLETEDNITYKFHNDNSSRLLGLSGEKFGMYASAVQEFRILSYDAKCLYNYAPSNLKVSVLKGSYVTLTWDVVAGATKYQYSDDATNWTDCGTEPTVTINGLEGDTEYIYYIRAYHEDAGVTNECIDYAEITFTTADCDDVPTNISYSADLSTITVTWTASSATSTVKLYSDKEGTTVLQTTEGTNSVTFEGLIKNTQYYVQVFAGGTCASQIIPVRTEDVEVDIVEWMEDGIIVDINTNETVGVTLENEVSYGSGTGSEATELFFSKYYEATTNVKLVAIYNGTKNLIDLTDYEIHYGKTPEKGWETNYITLKDFGATKGQIQPGEELILYSKTDGNNSDESIMDCVNEDYPDGKWVQVTQKNNDGGGHLSFAGDKTIVLKKAGTIIDIIGAINSNGLPNNAAVTQPSWGDADGWTCATGLSIADDTQIGISTNRCLLIRNNTVTSGENAVTSNINDFVTLCSEWKGAQVPDNNVDNGVAASCENFAYVGTFDYSDYYTKFESMGDEKKFDENARNADGTVTIPITDLYKQSCRNIRVKLSDKDGNVLTDREYKVPIMITTTQGTNGQAFLDLQQNLATKEVDGEGNVIDTHPLSLEEVREICKTCDVVVRDNATLQKMADDAENDHPQVRDIYVYENSSLVVPNGTNYTINNLSLRRKGDDVASLNVYPGALKLPESAAAPISLTLRVDAQNWHWFTLPYNCNISEVKWIDGSPAQYNVDWFLMTYDGESRSKEQSHYENHWKQYFGTTIEAGKGYIVGITGDINNPEHTFELRFPMAKEVLEDETTDKTVDVRAWGVEDDIRPNQKGWNLVGNPYLAYYQRDNVNSFGGLRLGELIGPDPQTGHWTQTGNLPYVVVPVEGGWVSYEQLLVSETDLLPFTAYFVQVGNDGTHNSTQDLKVSFDHSKLQLSATPMPASIIQRSASEIDEMEEPVIVGVSLTNSKGESDKTSLIIDDQYTDEYEMNADFFKWFGDYYKYYTKPVLYTIGADQGKRAFNALSEELATQPVSLGMYAAQAGNYTFSLDLRSDLSKVQEVWLYDATQDTYTNLLQDSYSFQTAKTESAGRFFLSVKMAPKVSTNIDNIADGTIWATTQDHTIFVNGLLSNAQLWLYDATGKLLHTDQTQYYQHSYSVPQAGTYFVRVQNTMQTQTIKVVVE